MKRLFLSISILMMYLNISAQDFSPQEIAPLQDHLLAVNQQWLKVPLEGTRSAYSFERESQRIKIHLSLVESYLRQNLPSGLSKQQLLMRFKALDILRDYYQAERFPVNYFHSKRTPYFVDQNGTACAVGHLIIESGNAEIAARISKENNHAYIAELDEKYPELNMWATQNGFTIDELAWIQPGYPPINQEWNPVGNGGGCDGVVNVMDAAYSYGLYLAGSFSEMDGVNANNIIGWDGEEWFTLGNGVEGEIFDMQVFDNGKIIIVGDFQVVDHPEIINLAYWEDGEWKGFETTNMTGSIHAIDYPFIGGDFQVVGQDGENIKYIASFDLDEPYLSNYNHALSVDLPVYALDSYNGNLLVGGSFTETAVETTDILINHLSCNHLAYWNLYSSNWTVGFDHPFNPISSLEINAGKIYTGSAENTFPVGSNYDAGLWNPLNTMAQLIPDGGQMIEGIFSHEERVFYYGNLSQQPLVGTYSDGIYITGAFEVNYYEEGATFDASVTAMTYYNGEYYFAGDFTQVQGQTFPGIVSSPFDASTTPIHEIDQSQQVEVFTSKEQVNIHYEGLIEKCTLNFYNVNGQLMASKDLDSGDAELSMATTNWSGGIYFYSAVTGSETYLSGKISVTN